MKLRINDQRLAKRTVKLHWFGNVRQTPHNSWRIRAGFECEGNLFTIDRPLATLPLLRIGEHYHDGVPLSSQKMADMVDTITIPVDARVWTSKALQVCRTFNYYLYRNPELINQRIHSFESVGRVVHIPHVELIRALFALHKPLSNAMLQPNGLSFIVNRYSQVENSIEIRFSGEIAATSLTEDFIHHVSWIISKKEVLRSYESIFSIAHAACRSQFGTPLSFIPPSLDNVTFQFRGMMVGSEILVLEILSIWGIDFDLRQITYWHPSIKERTIELGHKKRRILRPDGEGFDIVNDTPKVDTHQPVVSHEPTVVGYTKRAEIVRVAEKSQVVHQGQGFIEREGRGGALTPASIEESTVGGKTQPIDVQSIEITNNVSNGELREFLEMIRRLRAYHPKLIIDTTLMNLPSGRQFAYLLNGDRRKCAVVRVQRQERWTYILEVSRMDGHSLSTLILYPTSNNLKENNRLILNTLHDLVYNQGHWNLSKLTSIRKRALRHTHSLIDEWVRKVFDVLA